MFCTNCGNQIPDGSSFCPMCGRTVQTEQQPVQQTEQQPVYTQPEQQPVYVQQPDYTQPEQQPVYAQQPVYTQPEQQPIYGQQPVYAQQPMYQQPVQQPKKKSAGKVILIVVLCLIGIPIILFASCIGCAACFASELETELENSGYTEEDYADILAGLEDALADLEGEDYDYDFDFSSDTSVESGIEGTWFHHIEGDEVTLTITANDDGTYLVEGDAFVEYFYGEAGDAEMVISDCREFDESLYLGTISIVRDGYYDIDMTVMYGEHLLEFWYDGNEPYCFFRDKEVENPNLAEDILGSWSYRGTTLTFEEGGIGEYIVDGETYYSVWQVMDDYVTVVYEYQDGGETYYSWFSYYAQVGENKLIAYTTFYTDTVDFSDATWDYIPYYADNE